MLEQNKVCDLFLYKGTKSCFYCGKPSHIASFCYKTKNRKRKNAKDAKDDDDYIFNAQWDTFQEYMQVDHRFGKHQAHDFA